MSSGSIGAYGLVIDGVTDRSWWNHAPEEWDCWDFTWCALSEDSQPPSDDSDRMVFPHLPGGFAVVDRRRARTTLHMPQPLTEAGLVHPYIGSTVAAHSYWKGWHTFHAGSALLGGAVWAFLGERERGKTSALAWLASRDVPVFSDDLLVIRGDTAVAGPRALDLRRSASQQFGIGSYIGVLGTRGRWRHRLPPVPSEAPFGGFVSLAWHPEVVVEPVPAAERLKLLLGSAPVIEYGSETRWLGLLGFPMISLRRPKSWEQLEQAMTALVNAIS